MRNTFLLFTNASDVKFTFYSLRSFLTVLGEAVLLGPMPRAAADGITHLQALFTAIPAVLCPSAADTKKCKSILDPNTKEFAFSGALGGNFHLVMFLSMNFKVLKQNSHKEAHAT